MTQETKDIYALAKAFEDTLLTQYGYDYARFSGVGIQEGGDLRATYILTEKFQEDLAESHKQFHGYQIVHFSCEMQLLTRIPMREQRELGALLAQLKSLGATAETMQSIAAAEMVQKIITNSKPLYDLLTQQEPA